MHGYFTILIIIIGCIGVHIETGAISRFYMMEIYVFRLLARFLHAESSSLASQSVDYLDFLAPLAYRLSVHSFPFMAFYWEHPDHSVISNMSSCDLL